MQTVHDEFMAQFGRHFTIRKVGAERGAAPAAHLNPAPSCKPKGSLAPALRPLFHFQVPTGKMDPNYQHPLIHIYLLKRRKEPLQDGEAAGAEADAQGAAAGEDGAGAAAGQQAATAAEEQTAAAAGEQTAAAGVAAAGGGCAADAAQPAGLPAAAESTPSISGPEPSSQAVAEDDEERLQAGSNGSGSGEGSSSERSAQYQQQFQTRRQGAMLARLLKDVKLGGGSEQPS